MDVLHSLLETLVHNTELARALTIRNVTQFILHSACLKDQIYLAQPSCVPFDNPPEFLPEKLQAFLSDLTGIPLQFIPECWQLLGGLVWNSAYVKALQRPLDDGFMLHGIEKGYGACLSMFTNTGGKILCALARHGLHPPSPFCTSPLCKATKPLKKLERRAAILYTFAQGPVPAYSFHLYCRCVSSLGESDQHLILTDMYHRPVFFHLPQPPQILAGMRTPVLQSSHVEAHTLGF